MSQTGKPGVGLGYLSAQRELPQLRYYSLRILNHHTMGVGPALSISLTFLPVWTWLLYSLSYKSSVQLVFRWFSMTVVL